MEVKEHPKIPPDPRAWTEMEEHSLSFQIKEPGLLQVRTASSSGITFVKGCSLDLNRAAYYWPWRHTAAIPALRRLRQEDHGFHISLEYKEKHVKRIEGGEERTCFT